MTLSPTPSAKSVSVVAGVRDTILWGSAGIVTSVPSSSVTVIGNEGFGVGDGTMTVGALVGGPAVGEMDWVPACVQPASAIASAPKPAHAERTSEWAATWVSDLGVLGAPKTARDRDGGLP